MSGFDLNQQEIDNRTARMPARTGLEPGAFDNFLAGTGKVTMQTLAKAGSAIDLLGAVGPIVQDKFTGGTEAQDRYFQEHEEVFGKAVDYWTPKPNEVGAAGQVVGQLLGTLPLVFASPGLAVGATQVSTAEDLTKKGVDPLKAQAVGAVQAAGLGLGIWVPILGKTLAQRVLLGGAGFNAVQGVATRGASGAILEGTPGAEDFKAFDPTSLTLDVLLGAAFGGIAHVSPAMRAEGAAWQSKLADWGAKLKPSEVDALITMRQAQHINADSMPGKPVDMADADAHVQRLRQAIDDLANDRPISVEQMPPARYEIDPARQAEAEAEAAKVQADVAEVLRAEVEPKVGDNATAANDPALDPWNEPQAPRTFEQRIGDETIRGELLTMKGETGWAEVGGRMIRQQDDGGNETITRTAWVPNVEWWPGRPKGLKETDLHKAIDKAVAGEKLKPAERRAVEYMADIAEQRQKSAAWKPTGDDLAETGLASHNELDAAMTARAAEIDEGRVEQLAIQHEADTVGFMRGIKDFLDGHDSQTAASRQVDQRAPDATAGQPDTGAEAPGQTGLDPLTAEAHRFAAENPDIPVVIGRTADGEDITTTPRQMMEESGLAVEQAHADATLFEVAASCLLGAQ